MQGLEEYIAEVEISRSPCGTPCVVQIFAKCDEERALVMELMEGGTLQDRLDNDSLPWFDRVPGAARGGRWSVVSPQPGAAGAA